MSALEDKESKKRFIEEIYKSFPLLLEIDIPFSFLMSNTRHYSNSRYLEDEFGYNEDSLLKKENTLLFNFCWSSEYDFIIDKCKDFLIEKNQPDNLNKFLNKISSFERLFNFEIPLDIDNYKFYLENFNIIPVLTVYLCDPCNENDDGIEIIISKDSSWYNINKITDDFFNYIYSTHFNSIYLINNKKKISELTTNEINIIKMLVY